MSTHPRPYQEVVTRFYTQLGTERASLDKLPLYCKIDRNMPTPQAESHQDRQRLLERTLSRCGYRRVDELAFQLPPTFVRQSSIQALVGFECQIFQTRTEKDGQTCVVEKYVPKSDRFIVRLDGNNERFKAKSFNLKRLGNN